MPVRVTWVRSLVKADSTCHRAAKPMCHSYRACAPSPGATAIEPTCPEGSGPQQERPLLWEAHTPQLESGPHSLLLEKCPCSKQQRPNTAINKYYKKRENECPNIVWTTSLSQFKEQSNHHCGEAFDRIIYPFTEIEIKRKGNKRFPFHQRHSPQQNYNNYTAFFSQPNFLKT